MWVCVWSNNNHKSCSHLWTGGGGGGIKAGPLADRSLQLCFVSHVCSSLNTTVPKFILTIEERRHWTGRPAAASSYRLSLTWNRWKTHLRLQRARREYQTLSCFSGNQWLLKVTVMVHHQVNFQLYLNQERSRAVWERYALYALMFTARYTLWSILFF